jgi:wyosine [tRNA(Phe)-imidazoG37] synthetase (radical SAM superfamily)
MSPARRAGRWQRVPHRLVYGPVPSRRLSFSLGIDILPRKTCSLDCVYCQLGSTRRTTNRRRAYYSVRAVLAQVREALGSGRRVDHITFSGSGEPTLNRNLGGMIRGLKRMTDIPVAVLTNGTLLSRRDVRSDLVAADIVLPSLDAATAPLFRAVNRPHTSLSVQRIIEALSRFRKEFKGQIWLEVMLVRGFNDAPVHVRALREAIAAIRPDRVQLNTVVRPPPDASAKALTPHELARIARALGDNAEVVADFGPRRGSRGTSCLEEAILAMVERRPVTAEDVSVSLAKHRDEVLKTVARLVEAKKIRCVRHGRKTFYEPA